MRDANEVTGLIQTLTLNDDDDDAWSRLHELVGEWVERIRRRTEDTTQAVGVQSPLPP